MKAVKQQWLILKHDRPIVESLRAMSFSSETNPGFELRDVNRSFLLARYIERIESAEYVETPFGGVEEVRSIRYVYFDFEAVSISKGVSLLKLINPPVGLKGFIQALMQALKHDASVEKVRFVLGDIYAAISKDPHVDRIIVNKISVSRVPVGVDSTARIEVISSTNALEEFKSAFSNPDIRLDKLSISLRMGHEAESLEVSSAGSIYCTAGVERFLRNSLIYM